MFFKPLKKGGDALADKDSFHSFLTIPGVMPEELHMFCVKIEFSNLYWKLGLLHLKSTYSCLSLGKSYPIDRVMFSVCFENEVLIQIISSPKPEGGNYYRSCSVGSSAPTTDYDWMELNRTICCSTYETDPLEFQEKECYSQRNRKSTECGPRIPISYTSHVGFQNKCESCP